MIREGANADEEAAHKFLDSLDEVIMDVVKQIFNADEMGLKIGKIACHFSSEGEVKDVE